MDAKQKIILQDCSTCVRRRIRCDLAQPSCKKCTRKGLECPGYERQLRWADGVAIRGKLRGKRIPVSPPQSTHARPSRSIETDSGSRGDVLVSRTSLGLDTCIQGFIEYYDKNLAGLMVWVDSEENDYRRLVLPMAADKPGLGFAIAAFAASHGPMSVSAEGKSLHEAARDACLDLIQRQLQEMNGRLTGGLDLNNRSDMADAEWMLACVLVIASYEMARNQTAAAERHRQAARTLVNVFGHEETCGRGLFAFLRNQLSIYDVLAATTSFDLSDIERTILPAPNAQNVLFADYLLSLHQITLRSRQMMVANGQLPASWLGESRIRSIFEQARGQTLMAAGKLHTNSSVFRRDFIRLVDIYHHSAVLYSYRCLGYATMGNNDWAASKTKLFEQLTGLEDVSLCAHNLPWPVFIAGTECHGDEESQGRVVALLDMIINLTGFRHYAGIKTFLRVFWEGVSLDWRPLASQFQANGHRIVAV